MHQPYVFDEFFESGLEESVSPFIKESSRGWGRLLPLKGSLLSLAFLALAFALSFSYPLAPLSWLCLAGVYFFAGVPKLIDALGDLLSFQINIDVLMTLAAFCSVLIGSAMEGGLLLVLFAISGSMEETVTAKAKSAVRSLHRLAPTTAYIVEEDGQVIPRHLSEVRVGEKILIKAGEIVPLDGEVVLGASSVNLVHLTGETLPAKKEVGDEVPAGGRNMEGTLTLRVTHTSADSTLARIITLITQAQEARPKFQRWLDKVSRTYASSIIAISFTLATALPWFTSLPYLGFEGSIYRSLAFLIAASPCALIIAIPIAYLSAISACARKGILLKGGITLDALASCSAVAFDKTGTLTTGELTCLAVEPLDPMTEEEKSEALRVAKSLETHAVHPIAQAILSYTHDLPPLPLDHFRAIPGYGLEAEYDGDSVYIGHSGHLSADVQKRLETAHKANQLLSVLSIKGKLLLFRFEDKARPQMKETLQKLKKEGNLRLLMLTGDHQANAATVAEKVGIDEVYADLRPEDKLDHVARLSQKGLAMVGDGINDAPALARATAGISMGQVGSRTAIDASDVVLLQDDIQALSWLWNRAHKTTSIVKQNVFLASVAIVFASLAALFGIIPLWLAVVLHEGGTVLVGLNSLRLLR